MMAVLSGPSNNALNKYLLGLQPNGTVVKTTHTYGGGTVTWWGILNEGTATWSLTSVGETKNPTGPTASPIRRTLTAKVPVTPTLTQPLNNPAWNYIYATRTGNTCDMTLSQSVQVGSPLYVNGNLCLQNTAAITSGPLVVRSRLTLSQSANAVGSSTAPINEAHVAGGCQWKNNPVHAACSSVDNVFAHTLDSSPTQIAAPAVDWDGWYRNASPGPYFPCYEDGAPDLEDADSRIPGELAPGSLARVRESRRQVEGAWDAEVALGRVWAGGRALVVVEDRQGAALRANGPGGIQIPAGDSIQLVSASFQGALYGTNAVDVDTTSQAIGPIVGSTVYLGQSTGTSFPSVTVAPAGTPGSPLVYAQPNPPQLYGG
jgi:hypothetical protein